MNARLVEQLFALLGGLTGPLKGYRTMLGVVGSLVLLVYAAMAKDVVLGGVALSQLFIAIGLRPEPVPVPTEPDEPAP